MRQVRVDSGEIVVGSAGETADRTLHELAMLRTRFLAEGISEEEKQAIAEEYDALVDQLPEDIQMFHTGLVAGDVVE